MSPLRTLHLIERQIKLCRLAPGEVDFLLTHHRPAIAVLPTARRHLYRVTPAGVAGVVVTPGRRVVIRSKIPLRNLFHLFDPLADLSADRDESQPGDGSEVIDFLAGLLAQRMKERAAAGLHHGYREAAVQGNYLVGRLDIVAQVRQQARGKEQIHSLPDEFTAEVACNQLPRTVAAQLLASGLLNPEVRAQLGAALAGFAHLEEVPLTPDVLARLDRERMPAEYAPLLDLCRLLIDSLAPTLVSGSQPSPAFLLPLERLFERYLTRTVQEGIPVDSPYRVGVQESYTASGSVPEQPGIHIRPDITLIGNSRPQIVLDAKWKRLPAEALVTEDLYQVLAYCTILGVSQAVLVYPGRRRRIWEYAFPHIQAQVQVRTLDVSGTAEQCRRARRRLGRAVRRMLESGSRSRE